MSEERRYTRYNSNNVVVGISMPQSLPVLMDEAAERRGLSRNAFVRLALDAQA